MAIDLKPFEAGSSVRTILRLRLCHLGIEDWHDEFRQDFVRLVASAARTANDVVYILRNVPTSERDQLAESIVLGYNLAVFPGLSFPAGIEQGFAKFRSLVLSRQTQQSAWALPDLSTSRDHGMMPAIRNAIPKLSAVVGKLAWKTAGGFRFVLPLNPWAILTTVDLSRGNVEYRHQIAWGEKPLITSSLMELLGLGPTSFRPTTPPEVSAVMNTITAESARFVSKASQLISGLTFESETRDK